MTTKDAQRLLQRYLAGECTPEEKVLLEGWWDELQAEFKWEVPAGQEREVHDRMLSRIRAELEEPKVIKPRIWYAAAAAVVLIAAGSWLWWSRTAVQPVPETPIAIEAPPGGDHAILTLANGKSVVLDSAANGTLAIQGKDRVVKQGGQLDYQGASKADGPELFNNLATPRGGQYKLVLADGTKVWLDAESSITYPTAFAGKVRQVSITGQAYFEVVHNANMPFEVKVGGEIVKDVGTAFNIDAYTDEPTLKITLASGAIAVDGRTELNKPGQQVEYKGGEQQLHDADLNAVLAWKDGLFYLTSADIGTVMRQVSRWYDVDVQFENGMPAGHITGEVPRNTMLSTVLQVLRTSGVHFTTEGKTIRVMP